MSRRTVLGFPRISLDNDKDARAVLQEDYRGGLSLLLHESWRTRHGGCQHRLRIPADQLPAFYQLTRDVADQIHSGDFVPGRSIAVSGLRVTRTRRDTVTFARRDGADLVMPVHTLPQLTDLVYEAIRHVDPVRAREIWNSESFGPPTSGTPGGSTSIGDEIGASAPEQEIFFR